MNAKNIVKAIMQNIRFTSKPTIIYALLMNSEIGAENVTKFSKSSLFYSWPMIPMIAS